MINSVSYCPNVSFFYNALKQLPLQKDGDMAILQFDAMPGLYQFTAIADGEAFDWDSLYINLELFGNKGQRTGPWDFDPTDNHRALMPSYWIELDGKRLGLWYFQRVSLLDLEAKQFRGNMAFHLKRQGKHELRFIPYQETPLPWSIARLEIDPQDQLLPCAKSTFMTSPPAARWAEETFWQEKRALLQSEHGKIFRLHLPQWFETKPPESEASPVMLPLLLAAWKLHHNEQALHALLELVQELIALPHWGNPRVDSYGNNGDMAAGLMLRNMCWIWRATLNDADFPVQLRASLQQKVLLQCERYFDLILLNRDYWGGSLLQDHGWRSLFLFGDAVLHLFEKLPQAELWVRYALPRIQRGLDAMPRDGVIPPSSFGDIYLYVEELAPYRDARIAYDGVDIYQNSPFHLIPAYLHAVLRPDASMVLTSTEVVGNDVSRFIGGAHFLAQIAKKYNDALAAQLARISLEQIPGEFNHATQELSFTFNTLGTFLSIEKKHPLLDQQKTLPPALEFCYFEDSCLVQAQQHEKDITFALRCGPLRGYHAEKFCINPCDEIIVVPGAGHFMLAREGRPLLTTPDFGYSLHSSMRSCLLIDNQGQIGDAGYPMSIPAQPPSGARIEMARHDVEEHTVDVRLNLARAYPAELGLTYYTRQFHFSPSALLVQDEILLNQPRKLSWLFQGKRDNGLTINQKEHSAYFGERNGIQLSANAPGLDLQITIRQTPVVWSYHSSSGRKDFDHACFQTTKQTNHAQVEFHIRWD